VRSLAQRHARLRQRDVRVDRTLAPQRRERRRRGRRGVSETSVNVLTEKFSRPAGRQQRPAHHDGQREQSAALDQINIGLTQLSKVHPGYHAMRRPYDSRRKSMAPIQVASRELARFAFEGSRGCMDDAGSMRPRIARVWPVGDCAGFRPAGLVNFSPLIRSRSWLTSAATPTPLSALRRERSINSDVLVDGGGAALGPDCALPPATTAESLPGLAPPRAAPPPRSAPGGFAGKAISLIVCNPILAGFIGIRT